MNVDHACVFRSSVICKACEGTFSCKDQSSDVPHVVLPDFLQHDGYSDVTLACEGQEIKCYDASPRFYIWWNLEVDGDNVI